MATNILRPVRHEFLAMKLARQEHSPGRNPGRTPRPGGSLPPMTGKYLPTPTHSRCTCRKEMISM